MCSYSKTVLHGSSCLQVSVSKNIWFWEERCVISNGSCSPCSGLDSSPHSCWQIYCRVCYLLFPSLQAVLKYWTNLAPHFYTVVAAIPTPAPVKTMIFLHSCKSFTASSMVLISFLFFLFGGSERMFITICHRVMSSSSGGGIVSGSRSFRIVRGSVPNMRCCWTKV